MEVSTNTISDSLTHSAFSQPYSSIGFFHASSVEEGGADNMSALEIRSLHNLTSGTKVLEAAAAESTNSWTAAFLFFLC